MGFTINLMSLLALSLAVGLLIDGAIVVRENIFRKLEQGYPVKVIALSAVILFISLGVAISPLVKKTFMPTGDQGEFMVSIELPPGTSIHATSDQAAAIEEELRSMTSN